MSGADDGRARGMVPPILSARLVQQARLEVRPGGDLAVCFDDEAIRLGAFQPGLMERALPLLDGLPFGEFEPAGTDPELQRLVRGLAARGLLEYRLASASGDGDDIVIEPQVSHYWPRCPVLGGSEVVALSRFAYLRRRANDLVLESPRAGALVRIGHPGIAALVATLSVPRSVADLHAPDGAPNLALIALLLDAGFLFRPGPDDRENPRASEGDADLVLWEFHDLLFHARSTEGRHANPVGATYDHAETMAPLPAVRPRWPGRKVKLGMSLPAEPNALSPLGQVLEARRSTREFDDDRPITADELSRFLDATARVRSTWTEKLYEGKGAPSISYSHRPYPSAGASHELELYLAIGRCDGVARGLYHYDAAAHALAPIPTRDGELDALFGASELAMGADDPPQILIVIAARFGRVSWKYRSVAYALILKDVGVLTQTLYLVATEMGLGGCAIGTVNIDLFARVTGMNHHVEGAVGQFALGRGRPDT